MALGRDVTVTWLGGATVLVRSPSGKSLLVDPWLESNPQCPPEHKTEVYVRVVDPRRPRLSRQHRG